MYHDFAGREIEDLEMDNMRADARDDEQHLRQAIREVEKELRDAQVSLSTSSVIIALSVRGFDLNVKRDWERIADLRADRARRTPAQNMGRIVARAPWGDDTYTAEDAENGCIPSDAVYVEEVGE